MFTIFYKGFYVHGYFDKPNVVVQREDLPNFLCIKSLVNLPFAPQH